MDNNRKYRSINVSTILMFIVIVVAALWMAGRMQMHRQEMGYTDFVSQVRQGNVTDVYIDLNRAVPILQYWNHSRSVPGSQKNSSSICSNSLVRKIKLPGVISLRKDLPI